MELIILQSMCHNNLYLALLYKRNYVEWYNNDFNNGIITIFK